MLDAGGDTGLLCGVHTGVDTTTCICSFTFQNARHNWWGAPICPFYSEQNTTGTFDMVGDNVLFIPFNSSIDIPVSHNSAAKKALIVISLYTDLQALIQGAFKADTASSFQPYYLAGGIKCFNSSLYCQVTPLLRPAPASRSSVLCCRRH